ncbi:hypothetical protein [uncultured Croceitalea sp.]|uniref:hypothetical protein n=1 Tax=uncultured Croceitalea sp. TaxID=1798908 RepID=UPI0033061588
MKGFIFSILLLVSINNCNQEAINIKYVAQTRGFFLQVDIEANIIKVVNERGGVPLERELSTIELERLKKISTKADFENVETLERSKSTYDAAAMASLQVMTNESEYLFEFDHGYPPEKLEELVNKIITLSEIVE